MAEKHAGEIIELRCQIAALEAEVKRWRQQSSAHYMQLCVVDKALADVREENACLIDRPSNLIIAELRAENAKLDAENAKIRCGQYGLLGDLNTRIKDLEAQNEALSRKLQEFQRLYWGLLDGKGGVPQQTD